MFTEMFQYYFHLNHSAPCFFKSESTLHVSLNYIHVSDCPINTCDYYTYTWYNYFQIRNYYILLDFV